MITDSTLGVGEIGLAAPGGKSAATFHNPTNARFILVEVESSKVIWSPKATNTLGKAIFMETVIVTQNDPWIIYCPRKLSWIYFLILIDIKRQLKLGGW